MGLKKYEKTNKERGAITLYVLLVCLFFTFVLSGIYILNLNKTKAQENYIKQIQENYSKEIENYNHDNVPDIPKEDTEPPIIQIITKDKNDEVTTETNIEDRATMRIGVVDDVNSSGLAVNKTIITITKNNQAYSNISGPSETGKKQFEFDLITLEEYGDYTIKITSEDNKGNKSQKEIKISIIEIIPDGNDIIKETITPNDWTNQNVKVTLSSQDNSEKRFIEYQIGSNGDWQKYEGEIEVSENCLINARIKSETGKSGRIKTIGINNIDKIAPNEFTPTVTKEENNIKVVAETTDKEATATNGCSGLDGYRFSIDGGIIFTNWQNSGEYAYENLEKGQYFSIIVEARDKVGNITRAKTQEIYTDSTYTVEHYVMDTYGDYSDIPNEIEEKDGETNKTITLAELQKDTEQYKVENGIYYDHAEIEDEKLKEIEISNGLVIKLYYARTYGTLTTVVGENIGTIIPLLDKQVYYYGADIPEIKAELENIEGYTTIFDKWTSSNDIYVKDSTNEIIPSFKWPAMSNGTEIILTATGKKNANKITITYDYQGATGENAIQDKEVTYGEKYGELPNPVKQYIVKYETNGGTLTQSEDTAKYTLDGWYTDQEYENDIDENALVEIPRNHTIYAKWTGGNITLPVPTKVGYQLEGWYSDQELKNKIDTGNSEYTPRSDITLYAKWTERGDTAYRVEHYVMGTDGEYPSTATDIDNAQGTTAQTLITADFQKTTEKYKIENGIYYDHAEVDDQIATETTILADGSRVIKLYYSRTYGTLTTVAGENIETVTEQNSVKYYYGAKVPELIAKVKTLSGYTVSFDKWISSDNNYIKDSATSTISQLEWPAMPNNTSITLTATGTKNANTFTITYDYDGATEGNTEKNKNVIYDEKYGELPSPIRKYTITYDADGGKIKNTTVVVEYTFDGWYTEETYKNKIIPSTIMNTPQNHTLYAKWIENNVTILEATKKGYDFLGWYESKESDNKIVNGGEKYTPTSDITLYAKWGKRGDTKYTVEHYIMDTDGLYSATPALTETKQGETEADISIASLQKTSSEYKIENGIYYDHAEVDGKTATETTILADGSRTIKLYYARTYGILTVAKGENIETVTEQNAVKYYYGATVPTLSAKLQTQIGYVIKFNKWNSNSQYLNNIGTNPTGTFTWPAMPNNTAVTLTATATKTANIYEVTYDYDNATGNNTTPSKNVVYNEKYGELPSPTREYSVEYKLNYTGGSIATSVAKYTFDGWYTENKFTNNVTSDTIVNISQNHTLYAKWTEKSITLPTPIRDGYTFEGWYIDDKLERKVSDGGSTYVPTSNVTLYAKWTEREDTKYSVEHYIMDTNGQYPEKAILTEEMSGRTEAKINPSDLQKTTSDYKIENGIYYDHAEADSQTITETNILPDGSRVIKLYYARTYGTLTTEKGDSIETITEQNAVRYYYGSTVPELTATVKKEVSAIITFNKWESNNKNYIGDYTTETINSFIWPAMPNGTEIKLTALANRQEVSSNITFTASETTWTNKDVTVTASTTEEDFYIETSTDGENWSKTNPVTLSENGKVQARLTNGTNIGSPVTYTVDIIDKVAPVIKGNMSIKTMKPGEYIQYELPEKTFTISSSESGFTDNQTFSTSSYTGLWRVLYNDDEHGLQIISANGVLNSDNHLAVTGKVGYDNYIKLLNEFSANYINTEYATEGRIVGSNPENPENKETETIESQNGTIVDGDLNYEKDIDTMKKSELVNIENDNLYFLGSQMSISRGYIQPQLPDMFAAFSMLVKDSEVTKGEMYVISDAGNINRGETLEANIRPIIKLKDTVRFSSGKGTENKPYTLMIDDNNENEIEVTTNSVRLQATDNLSGIKGYAITEDTTIPKTFTDSNNAINIDTIISKLNDATAYYMWVKDAAGNISNYKKIITKTLPDDVTLSQDTTEWTNRDTTVTAKTNSEYSDLIEISEDGENWNQKDSIIIKENKMVYARLFDGTNSSEVVEYEVSNIDKEKPTVKVRTKTYNAIRITATDSLSGIIGYAISEENVIPESFELYSSSGKTKNTIIRGLDSNTTYYIWAKDVAGNISEVITDKTRLYANITFTANETEWTNEDVTVTASVLEDEDTVEDYILQTHKNSDSWGNENPITFTENGRMYARIVNDEDNISASKSYSVSNIDKEKPKIVGANEEIEQEELSVGDYIQYIPPSQSYSITEEQSGGNWGDKNYSTTYDDKILWRVLYNDEEHGLQITSDNALQRNRIWLCSKNGYNNILSTLNEVSQNYLDEKYVSSARTFGSDPTNPEKDETEYYNGGTFKKGNAEDYYPEDYTQMESYGLQTSNDYWMPLRFDPDVTGDGTFCIETQDDLYTFGDIDDTDDYITRNRAGIRPVLTIKTGIKFGGGNGTEQSPYVLEGEAITTTNSVNLKATDNLSGIVGYSISTDKNIPTTFTSVNRTTSLNMNVSDLKSNTRYYIYVKDAAGNISDYQEILTKYLNTSISFSRSTSNWTNQDVTITAINSLYSDYIQTSTDKATWTKTNKVILSSNGTVYARVSDGTNTGTTYTCNVTNIDKVKPQIGADLSKEVLAKPGDYIKYTPPSTSFTITTSQSGYTSNQTFNTSSYTGLWKVLYNDNKHGLQIISDGDVTNGKNLYLKGIDGYNNSVSILNRFSEYYLNESCASSARSVGSDPMSPADATTKYFTHSIQSPLKVGDSNYMIDYNEGFCKGPDIETSNNSYWYASRFAPQEDQPGRIFDFSLFKGGDSSSTYALLCSYDFAFGEASEVSGGAGVRPVITIKTGLKPGSGDGTPSKPYEVLSDITVSENSINVVASDADSKINGYKVTTTSTQPSISSFTTISAVNEFKKTLTGLTPNTKYYIWVKDSAGNINYKVISTLPADVSTVVKPGNYVRYTPPSKSFTISSSDSGYTSNQTFSTSSYKGLWRVLYNDSSHGLQLISDDDVTNGSQLYLKGRTGYNNCISVLNNFCNNYINTAYARTARCVGTLPTNWNYSTTTYHYSPYAKTDLEFLKSDTNYLEDYNQMNSYSMRSTTNEYWIPSRTVQDGNNTSAFLYYNSGTSLLNHTLSGCSIMWMDYYDQSSSSGVRPVVTIKTGLKAGTGTGTKANPYELIEGKTADLDFKYSTTNWTNGSVTVTATTTNSAYTIQTSKDGGITWSNSASQTLTANGYVYARLLDGTKEINFASAQVTKIDKTAPKIASISTSGNSITFRGTDEDSGISGYYYKTNSSTPTSFYGCTNTDIYDKTITGLSYGSTYYVWVKDAAGNVSDYKSIKINYPNLSSVAKVGDYVKYTPPSTTFGMTVSETGALINNLSTQRFTTSDYTGLWQVLYNDSTHGLELISADSVDTLALGTAASPSNSKIAYNKCVQTLNTFSSYYVNTTYATSGRSVGSNPTNPNGTTSLYTNSNYSFVSKYVKDFIAGDSYYTYDKNAMTSANIINIGSNYWLASRKAVIVDWGEGAANRYSFEGGIRRINANTDTSTSIVSVWDTGEMTAFSQTYRYGVRPVIKLKTTIKKTSGSGTSSSPWRITT